MEKAKELSTEQISKQLVILKNRFEKNMIRHTTIDWAKVQAKLEAQTIKIWSLVQMEITGGEPDVVAYNAQNNEYIFFDCSAESPIGRRSFCYDNQALHFRKQNKPENSVESLASEMGIELLNEEQYRYLQTLGKFDSKTSSWIKTPENIHSLGGALFADFRYAHVFVYHNGAESYYNSRGFRGSLVV